MKQSSHARSRDASMSDPEVKTALVDELPNCDMPGCDEPAEYDARTRSGQWGNFCQDHFDQQGCRLGLGRGQKLVVRGSVKQPEEILSKADKLCAKCGKGCPEDSFNKETMRMRILDDEVKVEAMIMMGLYCEEI